MKTKVAVSGFSSVFVGLLAYLYTRPSEVGLPLDKIKRGLLEEEASALVAPNAKVALAFGGCVDGFVDALPFLSKIGAQVPDTPEHYGAVSSQKELEELFAYFFRHGAASERYVSDADLFRKYVELARAVPGFRLAIGGNAPVMANRLAREGIRKVLLGATFTRRTAVEGLLEPVVLAGNHSMWMKEDDIHLILEYPKDAKWGPYTASRANRLIIHSDVANAMLSSLDSFKKDLSEFNAQLLVVGGLQMMDSFVYQEGERFRLLGRVRDVLSQQSVNTRVHFEMASFSNENLLSEILELVIPYADSLGMNEQELEILHGKLLHGEIKTVADSNPRVATALDHMRSIFELLADRQPSDGRRLTRLHIHTLAYQALMVVRGSLWRNTAAATAKAALTAFRHTCASAEVDLKKARIIMDESFSSTLKPSAQRVPVDPSSPVSCWEEGNLEICVAPVLVCTEVYQTAGGGDNISSAGLVLQI